MYLLFITATKILFSEPACLTINMLTQLFPAEEGNVSLHRNMHAISGMVHIVL